MRLELACSPYFQESAVPDEARLAGWAALVKAFSIKVPVRQPSCVSEKHIKGSQRRERTWRVFDKRYWPGDTLADHLIFAFRHAWHHQQDPLFPVKRLDLAFLVNA